METQLNYIQDKCVPFWWVAAFYFRPELKWASHSSQEMLIEFINDIAMLEAVDANCTT